MKLTSVAAMLFVYAASLQAETHRIVPEKLYRTFGNQNPVLLRIKSGDTVVTKTVDAAGYDDKNTKRHPESGNPLTGPFYVEGAEPGDGLAVVFKRIRMNRNSGWSAYRLCLYSLTPDTVEHVYSNQYKPDAAVPGRTTLVPWELDLEKQMVRLREPNSGRTKLEFPARPMLGCVGVAAPSDFAPISAISGPYGGNMDYNELVEGVTVILPVFHPGALLYVGDGHALQADGEPTGTGIETSMDVEFTVEVRKNANLTNPRLENSDYIISIGSQPEFQSPLDRALQIATSDMVRWLEKDYGLEPWAAHLLVGYQGRYDVVTVQGSMALRIPKRALPARN
ncbi:MAG TPA: acetamidase/formamidase family protein [Bryobacteraceae bacterium]|nr:acetamidase/formamidase family protein [Bryobacteraceae bacterium]